MRRGVAAVGTVLAASLIIQRIRVATRGHSGGDYELADGLTAYCLSCGANRPIENPQTMLMKNQRTGIKGSCPVCGKGLVTLGSKAA
jgi:hypothetical protein